MPKLGTKVTKMGFLLNLVGGSKLKLIAIAVAVTVLCGLLATIKIQYSKIDTLNQSLAAERAAHATTTASFDEYKDNAEAQAARTERSMADLATSRYKAQKEIEELSKLLDGHDLGKLMRKKPGMLEKRINDKTRDLFKRILWNPDDHTWSAYDEALYWIRIIDSGQLDVDWLLYAGDQARRGRPRTCGPRVSPTGKTPTFSTEIHGAGGGARRLVRGRYQTKRGVGLPVSARVQSPGPGFLADHWILA